MTLVMYGRSRGLKAVPASRPEGAGSIIRTGLPVAGERADVGGQGLPLVKDFTDEVVAGYRRRLTLLGDCGERRAVEDGIALLTDRRLVGIDGSQFEQLLSMLRSGRAPAGLSVLRPEKIGVELTRRWREFAAARAAGS